MWYVTDYGTNIFHTSPKFQSKHCKVDTHPHVQSKRLSHENFIVKDPTFQVIQHNSKLCSQFREQRKLARLM